MSDGPLLLPSKRSHGFCPAMLGRGLMGYVACALCAVSLVLSLQLDHRLNIIECSGPVFGREQGQQQALEYDFIAEKWAV